MLYRGDALARFTASLAIAQHNLVIRIAGGEVKLLILKMITENTLEDKLVKLVGKKSIPAIIDYPSDMIIFTKRDENGKVVSGGASYVEDLLPITIQATIGDDFTLSEGDIIVQVLHDEYGDKVPYAMQVTNIPVQVNINSITSKEFQCAPFRDSMAKDVWQAVIEYANECQ